MRRSRVKMTWLEGRKEEGRDRKKKILVLFCVWKRRLKKILIENSE